MLELALLAQTSDPISGGAGWVGAGLLGLVLGWLLLKHIPDKDRQLKELISEFRAALVDKDVQMQRVIESHLAAEKQQRQDHAEMERAQRAEYKDTLTQLLKHNREQMDGLGHALKEDLAALQEGFEQLTAAMRGKV